MADVEQGGRGERLTASALMAITVALAFLLIPSLPFLVGLALALVTSAIALRLARLGILLTFLLLGLAYAYQLGGLLGHYSGIFALLLFLFFGVVAFIGSYRIANALGAALGATMALITLTPAFSLAVPLAIFFVTTYRSVSKSLTIASFLELYILLQVLAIATTKGIPRLGPESPIIYSQVQGNFLAPPQVLTFATLLGTIANGGPGIEGMWEAFAFWLIQYFIGSFSITTLTLLIIVAISSAFLLEELLASFRPGGMRIPYDRLFTPLLSNFVASAVFAGPLIGLEGSLGYSTTLEEHLVPYFSLSLLGAMVAALFKLRLERAQERRRMREVVEGLLEELKDRLGTLEGLLKEVELGIKGIRLQELAARLLTIKERYELAGRTYAILGLRALGEREAELKEALEGLGPLEEELKLLVVEHFNDALRRASSALQEATERGFRQEIRLPQMEGLLGLGLRELLDAHRGFEELVGRFVRELIGQIGANHRLVRERIDPQYTLTGLELASNFLERGELDKALDSALESLRLLDEKFRGVAEALKEGMKEVLDGLCNILEAKLLPLARWNPLLSFEEERSLAKELAEMRDALDKGVGILDLSRLLSEERIIEEGLRRLLELLRGKLLLLEEEVEKRVPKGYSWGREEHVLRMLEKALKGLAEARRLEEEYFEAHRDALRALEEGCSLLDRYLLAMEFIINYPNVDSLITAKLKRKGVVGEGDLPLRFADRYLLLYSWYHKDTLYDDVRKVLLARG